MSALRFEAEVTEIHEAARADGVSLWKIGLSRTEFGAGDHGWLRARARSGAELEAQVLEVERDAAGTVWHYVRKPLLTGTRVEGEVKRGD